MFALWSTTPSASPWRTCTRKVGEQAEMTRCHTVSFFTDWQTYSDRAVWYSQNRQDWRICMESWPTVQILPGFLQLILFSVKSVQKLFLLVQRKTLIQENLHCWEISLENVITQSEGQDCHFPTKFWDQGDYSSTILIKW